MRTYDEPIHVLFTEEPRQFIWRDRLLLVKEIQGRWSRATPWWSGSQARALRGDAVDDVEPDPLAEREVWRVEAGNGRQRGVYELARTVNAEDWVLQAVLD
ncbi:hypothetical protein SAMN02745244_00252 [Tessaracoccus bendigoensis DSM 12906]|uniref:DUF6504 domain-containing protein n=1 Tax=Tessaracoccus bendigoensis DSM 12906 TaxID=1123357 RepID=A0A1M6ARR4_9ACTN|nr:DUF6504 family protein [Tessaracoccus bendigoensis]SHI39111.1 hypothetical protein SAMN02745244_00252 [Tessaracoccus bendigoensis DSM 12906]